MSSAPMMIPLLGQIHEIAVEGRIGGDRVAAGDDASQCGLAADDDRCESQHGDQAE
jgi:hypothetical protein